MSGPARQKRRVGEAHAALVHHPDIPSRIIHQHIRDPPTLGKLRATCTSLSRAVLDTGLGQAFETRPSARLEVSPKTYAEKLPKAATSRCSVCPRAVTRC